MKNHHIVENNEKTGAIKTKAIGFTSKISSDAGQKSEKWQSTVCRQIFYRRMLCKWIKKNGWWYAILLDKARRAIINSSFGGWTDNENYIWIGFSVFKNGTSWIWKMTGTQYGDMPTRKELTIALFCFPLWKSSFVIDCLSFAENCFDFLMNYCVVQFYRLYTICNPTWKIH